jgi:CRISPR-associated protein Csm4
MKLFLYQLRFKGPVRFGASGIGLEETALTLDSDGLTSAFLNALAASAGSAAVEGYLNASQAGEPPMVFSSLFPFGPDPLDSKRNIWAVPRPLSAPPASAESLRHLGKKLKRLRWLRPEDAASWLGGKELSLEGLERLWQRSQGLAAEIAAEPEDRSGKRPGWYVRELRPRVALDRNTATSNLWACAAVRFAPGAGLYGLVRLEEAWQDCWLQTMRLLGEMGLGGERTYGFGEFRLTGPQHLGDEWHPLLNLPSARRLLLSTYYPTPEEKGSLAEAVEAWEITESRGYIVSGRQATTFKRKRVRLMASGSVFRRPLKGALADVTPDDHEALGLKHRVYRVGFAFLLPGS